jgi:hypothetical protein
MSTVTSPLSIYSYLLPESDGVAAERIAALLD